MTRTVAAVLLTVFAAQPLAGQTAPLPAVWRTFAEQLDTGTRIRLRLTDGARVTATLIQAAPDALVIQPVTRVPVPVQRVPYDLIASIERDEGRGLGPARAALIGVAVGAAAFVGLLVFVIVALD